jgi:hypothetical protein
MFIRFRIALLTLLLPFCALAVKAQMPVVPDIEYAKDMSELKSLHRVFVHSEPDPLARFAIVKELNRHPELLEVVETPEEADFYLVFYSLAGGGVGDPGDFSGEGGLVISGNLVAFRQIKTCTGSRRRLIFVTRKTKTFHRFTLPLSSSQSFASSPRAQTGRGAATEMIVRLGLGLLQRTRKDFLSFNQLSNSGFITFSRKVEVGAAKTFIKELKKVHKQRPSVNPTLLGLTTGVQKDGFVKPNLCGGSSGFSSTGVLTPKHTAPSRRPRRSLNKRPQRIRNF